MISIIDTFGYNVATVASMLLAIFVVLVSRTRTSNQRGTVQYPPFAPVGFLKAATGVSGLQAPWFLLDLARKTSSDIFKLPIPIPGGFYIINHPAIAREILTDKSTDKPTKIYEPFANVAGHENIFTRPNNAQWKAVRKGTAHAFSLSQVNRMNRICAKHVKKWIAQFLEPLVADTNADASDATADHSSTDNIMKNQNQHQSAFFDPSKEMLRLTFGAIMESAFEYESSEEEFNNFLHHVENGLVEFALKQAFGTIRKYYAFLDPSYWNAVRSCRIIQAFAQRVLNTYRNNPNKSSHNTVIKLITQNESLKTDRERVSEMIVFMVAGFDTTGFTLSNTLILLAKHPRVADKLQKELLSMEPDQRSKSKYLKCVIEESKRLLPVAAMGSIRVTGRDFTFNDYNGNNTNTSMVVLPKNANVFIPFVLMHRHAGAFEDPDSFHPERWQFQDDDEDVEDDNDGDDCNKNHRKRDKAKAKAMKEALMPFSVGNRNCPGQSLALAEIYSVLPRILANYKLHVEREGDLEYFLTLKYKGCLLKATRVGTEF